MGHTIRLGHTDPLVRLLFNSHPSPLTPHPSPLTPHPSPLTPPLTPHPTPPHATPPHPPPSVSLDASASPAPPDLKADSARRNSDLRLDARFPPHVVNRMGTPAWDVLPLSLLDLVAATQALFMKARVPEELCPRKTFVQWSRAVLQRHAAHPFHNAWHAVDAMHALYTTLR